MKKYIFILLSLIINNHLNASDIDNKKPKIIGVVSDYAENKNNTHNYSSHPIYLLREQYIKNLSKVCQGENVVLIVIPNDIGQIDKFVDIVDGLILTGGGDIDSRYFNQKKHPESGNDSIMRTEFEINILKKIILKKKPVLGICRGMQLINVALGGDMIQDILSYIKTNINHSFVKDGVGYLKIVHNVRVSKNSLASKILKNTEIGVNSNHHQAIGKLGKDLKATGFSVGDNIIEIIELENYSTFFLGVQWHPEFLASEYDKEILKMFCKSVGD